MSSPKGHVENVLYFRGEGLTCPVAEEGVLRTTAERWALFTRSRDMEAGTLRHRYHALNLERNEHIQACHRRRKER